MRIVGLGGGLHDMAACLVEDGRLVSAIEKERLTQVRHSCDHELLTAGFRAGSFKQWQREMLRTNSAPDVDYVLDGAPLTSVDAFTHGTQRNYVLSRTYTWPWLWPPLWTSRHMHGLKSHHLAHAASAFLVSPFDEALTVVIDAFGTASDQGVESSSLWWGRDRELKAIRIDHGKRVATDHTPATWPPTDVGSLGVFYSDITLSCGFRVLDAGKTMGLAPWGSDRFLKDLGQYFEFASDGRVLIDQRYLLFLREWEQRHAALEGEDRFAHEADLAFAGQTLIEEAVLHIVRWGAEHTKLRKLCLAGGVALNAVANGRIVAETPIEEVYVQPGANDAGVAIGAAYFTYYKMSGKPREFVMDHCYLGKTYGKAEIDTALARFRGQPRLEQPADVVERTADLLAEGKIVGWYQGGSEFGPRALGNRSILADPRSKETWGRVNEIKSREWFRPLAPSVLAEHQSEYFDFAVPSPYMLMIAHVRPEKRELLGAITHVDGTSRLQTVDQRTNPRFHRLISAFHERTGVPMLLNTSFNIQAPIAETPKDAVDTFLRSELDALVIGDRILMRQAGRAPEPAARGRVSE